MRKLIFLKIAAGILVFGTAATYITMLLWNWLMPEIFGLTQITFWQALGLLLLSKLIFGFHKGGRKHDHDWKKKWEKLPAERREQWKQRFADKWCQFENAEKSEENESI